jgi:membrane protein DedA with SNARE-associated domain
MSLSDQLLAALVQYGLPALFVTILVTSAGAPLPATLLLVTAGSFVQQGDFSYWSVVALTLVAAVIGDNIGYWIGRRGGRLLVTRLSHWIGGERRVAEAEAAARRWGGVGIFLSRWLLTPIGPTLNLTSGVASYSWPAFLGYDLVGEALWVVMYVGIGRIFSDRVQALADLLGDMAWTAVGIVAVAILGWKLLAYYRGNESNLQVSQTSFNPKGPKLTK